jgi:hypothetical protein
MPADGTPGLATDLGGGGGSNASAKCTGGPALASATAITSSLNWAPTACPAVCLGGDATPPTPPTVAAVGDSPAESC